MVQDQLSHSADHFLNGHVAKVTTAGRTELLDKPHEVRPEHKHVSLLAVVQVEENSRHLRQRSSVTLCKRGRWRQGAQPTGQTPCCVAAPQSWTRVGAEAEPERTPLQTEGRLPRTATLRQHRVPFLLAVHYWVKSISNI